MQRGHVTGTKRERTGASDWYKAIEAEHLKRIEASGRRSSRQASKRMTAEEICTSPAVSHNHPSTADRKVAPMVAVKEITWEEASAPGFEHTTKHAFRAAVDQVALRAKATLPECHGRVEKAVAIVLAGDVELLAEGHARVASQCRAPPCITW